MRTEFEWHEAKARSNARKHGISFDEAVTIFDDPIAVTLDDPDHSEEERRFVTIGWSVRNRILVVRHCERGDRTRLIGARTATQRERRYYEGAETQ